MGKPILFSILALCSYSIAADEPNVPSDAPYIVLSENLDEPNGFGFCLDTLSRGKTDLMHAHSCKPAKVDRAIGHRDNDTRFYYDQATLQIKSFAFEGFCMQALRAAEVSVFALLQCVEHNRQKFSYDVNDKTLRLHEDRKLCVAVSETTEIAGPWVKRSLLLEHCAKEKASRQRWTVVNRP